MGVGSDRTNQDPNGQVFMSIYMQTGSSSGFREHALFPGKWVQWVVVMEIPSAAGGQYPIMHVAMITAFINGDVHVMWAWYGYHASFSHVRYVFMAPPFEPLHAHCPLAHVGPDINGDPMWAMKNIVCGRPGENNPNKFGPGRYHMVSDGENQNGHATQEELLVE